MLLADFIYTSPFDVILLINGAGETKLIVSGTIDSCSLLDAALASRQEDQAKHHRTRGAFQQEGQTAHLTGDPIQISLALWGEPPPPIGA